MKQMQLVYFPEEFIALAKEAMLHDPLVELMREQQNAEWDIKFGIIAAYCEVMIDGIFNEADMTHLAGVLTSKLQSKRGVVVGMEEMKPLIILDSSTK